MQGESHQGKGLKYFTVTPDDYDPAKRYPLIIMLHGFGANMQDLAGLAPEINRTGYVYACPNAPIAFDLGLGHAGYGWTSPRGDSTPALKAWMDNGYSGFEFHRVLINSPF